MDYKQANTANISYQVISFYNALPIWLKEIYKIDEIKKYFIKSASGVYINFTNIDLWRHKSRSIDLLIINDDTIKSNKPNYFMKNYHFHKNCKIILNTNKL